MSLIYVLTPRERVAEAMGLRKTLNQSMHLVVPLAFGSLSAVLFNKDTGVGIRLRFGKFKCILRLAVSFSFGEFRCAQNHAGAVDGLPDEEHSVPHGMELEPAA